jgi:hypothetical protein
MDVVEQRTWTDEDLAVLRPVFVRLHLAVRVLARRMTRALRSAEFPSASPSSGAASGRFVHGWVRRGAPHNRPPPSAALHVAQTTLTASPMGGRTTSRLGASGPRPRRPRPRLPPSDLQPPRPATLASPALGLDLRVVDSASSACATGLRRPCSPGSPVAPRGARADRPRPAWERVSGRRWRRSPCRPEARGRAAVLPRARDPGGAIALRGGRNGRRVLRRARKGRPRPTSVHSTSHRPQGSANWTWIA